MTYSFIDAVKDVINGEYASEEKAQARYSICQQCDLFDSVLKICNSCGCVMPAKVKLANSECPEGFWK